MDKKSSFPPSVETGAEVLLLGSMPGEESLRRLQAKLIDAQQKAEELFISDGDADSGARNI